MKKALMLSLVITLAVGLCSCATNSSSPRYQYTNHGKPKGEMVFH